MPTLLQGAVAGILAGAVMAVLMMAMSRGQPGIPAMFAARLTGKPPAEARMAGMGVHFAYALLLGLVFVIGTNVLSVDALLGLNGLWANGVLFGLLLFLVAAAALMPAAGVTKEMRSRMPRSQIVGILFLHILFGLILVASLTYIPIA